VRKVNPEAALHVLVWLGILALCMYVVVLVAKVL
jgi:hypothetical protein